MVHALNYKVSSNSDIWEEYDEELHIRNEKAISYEDGFQDGFQDGVQQGERERKSLQMENETLRREIAQLRGNGDNGDGSR